MCYYTEKLSKGIFMRKSIITALLIVSALLLCACGATANKWDINIQDNEGHGVPGVTVQLCTDSTCKLLTTDENGAIAYDGDESSCEIHIFSVPEGYEETDHVFTVDKGVKTIINLDKSSEDVNAADAADADAAGEVDTAFIDGKITFTTVDMNGNTVDDSIFAENKVTMVNLWEPWCSPCKSEMPDLEKLYQEYKDQGFAIIGVHMYDEDLESVVKETGVTYPILEATDEFKSILNTTQSVPTTFFVDSDGNILMPDVDDEVYQETLATYVAYYESVVEAYKNGEYDAYKDDPNYSDYFATLEAMSQDEDLIQETAEKEASGVYDDYTAGYYVGAKSYDAWKELIEEQLAKVS